MKKFFATMIFVFSVFALVSCGGSDGGSTHCEDSNDDSCNYKACAKEGGKVWYEYNGKKYECKGSGATADCSEAAQTIVMDCMGL
ncbi:hypothetical protein IKO70_08760 [bacterium]|jgi:hypothetical protein|nr:hypothetical protein [bacterium]MBR4532483.1 hypothetical protein [bacterium]